MGLDLTDLRLFLNVVDAGSITQGAARAHLALASASERLRRMETAVGVQLLERLPRGVATTEAGEALAHHARLILQQQHQLQDELRDFSTGACGTLHLYANTAAMTDFLPRRLAAWLAGRPRQQVELKERTSQEIIRAIGSGVVEAGIVSDAVDAQGLQQHAVGKDQLVLLLPVGHRFTRRETIHFQDVLGEAFVGLMQGDALQEHVDQHARQAGRELTYRIRMKAFDGVCEMVAGGVGIAVVPRTSVRRRRGCSVLPLADGWAHRRLCLCYRSWNELSRGMQSLLQHLGAVPPRQ